VSPTIEGPALTDVQFALDVDQSGQAIYPANEFVSGITRIYVRFAYQGLEGVPEVNSSWYLNDNLVISNTLAWDGGGAGYYVIWMEDPTGIRRGEWRWELAAVPRTQDALERDPLGVGTFTIGGEPRYINGTWGLSFDPPATWELQSEEEDFVTFSSPDQRQALALRVSPATAALTETAAAELALFQENHPDADVVATQDVTLSGEPALLQQVRYTDEEHGEQLLFIVSTLRADGSYSLWTLGPADQSATLQSLLIAALRSIQFSTD
jgi:hypothetical protein